MAAYVDEFFYLMNDKVDSIFIQYRWSTAEPLRGLRFTESWHPMAMLFR